MSVKWDWANFLQDHSNNYILKFWNSSDYLRGTPKWAPHNHLYSTRESGGTGSGMHNCMERCKVRYCVFLCLSFLYFFLTFWLKTSMQDEKTQMCYRLPWEMNSVKSLAWISFLILYSYVIIYPLGIRTAKKTGQVISNFLFELDHSRLQ